MSCLDVGTSGYMRGADCRSLRLMGRIHTDGGVSQGTTTGRIAARAECQGPCCGNGATPAYSTRKANGGARLLQVAIDEATGDPTPPPANMSARRC